MVKELVVKYETYGDISASHIAMLTVVDAETGCGKVVTGSQADELYKRLTEED